MPEDVKEILNQLAFSPTEKEINVDFDLEKKIFILSIAIYESEKMGKSVEEYVMARQDRSFKPHSTSFLKEKEKVLLVQKIPFQWGFRPSVRKDILEFLQLAKRCHRMLYEIAFEEKCKQALDCTAS